MDNNLYFFILGRNPTLSIAEIISLFSISNHLKIKKISKEVLILELKEKIDFWQLQERLGGTIKIGKIIAKVNKNLEKIETNLFLKELPKIEKVYFGFSLYQLNNKFKIENLRSKIKNLALKIKKELKKRKISSRWVESKERILSSVIVQKNKLLTHGKEFVFLVDENEIYLGESLTCQFFQKYEFYDFSRPKRKIEEGMIPLKLAKIMINLAKVSKSGLILDPFCGSGTILQEAILMGYKKIVGTDLNEEAVENAKKNIKWLLKNLKLKSKLQIKIEKCDVRNLSEKIQKNSVEAIITEPYLGPIKIKNYKFKILSLINKLSNLYLTAFLEFKKILKKDGKVVIVFPIFKMNKNFYFLPILEKLKKSGWQVINPIPPELQKNPIIKLTSRQSIIYSRPDQKVLREIFIFLPLQNN